MDSTGITARRRVLERLYGSMLDVCRFLRLSVVAFSLMLPLIGAAATGVPLTMAELAKLAAAGFAFHIFGYVSNDVFDLAIDRTQPLRAGSPLVRGIISPRAALIIALVPVPLVAAFEIGVDRHLAAGSALLVGLAFGLVYNRYGKRFSVPPLSDAVQALAWVSLTLYGALATVGHPTTGSLFAAATVFAYVMMINGLHGGLRDLVNDRRHGAHTTMIYLGARVSATGRVVATPGIVAYGLSLQVLLLCLVVAGVLWCWPANALVSRSVIFTCVFAGHVVLLMLARAALRADAATPDVLRAGMAHLFVSLGLVCLPFGFFSNALTAAVIVTAYAVPLSVLLVHMRRSVKRRAVAMTAMAFALLVACAPAATAQVVRVVAKEEIVRAMELERAKGYDIRATPNGARFNAAVVLQVARWALDRDPSREPLILDHRDYFDAFLQVSGSASESVPPFIRSANDYGEDLFVDYRAEHVIAKLQDGSQPRFAVNVIGGWTGPAASYSYEDLASSPSLRVTHERRTSYRLLDFGDAILFDDIQGISGRVTSGALALLFRFFGDGRAVRSFIAIAPDQTQVTITTGRKGPFAITTSATVYRNGHGEKGVPGGRPDLKAIEDRLRRRFTATYVRIPREDVFSWRRMATVRGSGQPADERRTERDTSAHLKRLLQLQISPDSRRAFLQGDRCC